MDFDKRIITMYGVCQVDEAKSNYENFESNLCKKNKHLVITKDKMNSKSNNDFSFKDFQFKNINILDPMNNKNNIGRSVT